MIRSINRNAMGFSHRVVRAAKPSTSHDAADTATIVT